MIALGTHHARSCADATSLHYDGAEFYNFATLNSRAGKPVAELQFGDGLWKLCDPAVDILPYFTLDSLPGRFFHALGYGAPWHGWATPVVDADTCQALLTATGEPHRWDGSVLVLDDGTVARTDQHGHYDLGGWGWTFVTSTHWL